MCTLLDCKWKKIQKVLVKISNMLYSRKGFAKDKERGIILKVFYGGTFMNKKQLEEAGIQYPIKLEYYKMINEDELTKHTKEKYGIKIIKTEYKENNVKTEEKELQYLSNDEYRINKMLNLFRENEVTPVIAEDIADDLLKQTL